jgi:hypothetical protein
MFNVNFYWIEKIAEFSVKRRPFFVSAELFCLLLVGETGFGDPAQRL